MSHRRAKRLRMIIDVKGRAYSNVLNQSLPGPVHYTEGSVRTQYKTYKKLHRENKFWKLPTLKQMHESIWQ